MGVAIPIRSCRTTSTSTHGYRSTTGNVHRQWQYETVRDVDSPPLPPTRRMSVCVITSCHVGRRSSRRCASMATTATTVRVRWPTSRAYRNSRGGTITVAHRDKNVGQTAHDYQCGAVWHCTDYRLCVCVCVCMCVCVCPGCTTAVVRGLT